MSNIKINAFPTRKQYTYAGGTPEFVLDFPFFENEDIFVYVSNPATNGTQQDPQNLVIQGTDYTVTGAGLPYGGVVTFSGAYGLTVGYTVTVVARMAIDRYSILETTSAITRAQYNEDMNRLTCMIQQINTIIEQTMPKYDRSEFINTVRSQPNTPFSYVNLPWLPAGYTWVGNATETGLSIFNTGGGGGVGYVTAAHPNMQPSIALWTGTDFVLTDSAINIVGNDLTPLTPGDTIGVADTAAAWGLPSHGTAGRPVAPDDGDIYHDTDLSGIYVYYAGTWHLLSTGDDGSVVTDTITQANTFVPGNIVRFNKDTLLYVLARANSRENGEVIGIVTSATALVFTIQFIGKVTVAGAGWIPGRLYYLSPTTDGLLSPNAPVTNGQIDKPLLIATSATTGVFFNFRGYVVGNGSPVNQGEEIIVVTITQVAHGFTVLDALYTDTPEHYALAFNDGTYHEADVIGIVKEVIDADHFVMQVIGRNTTMPLGVLPGGANLVANTSYFLHNTANAGKLTAVEPTTIGHYSRLVLTTTSTTTGWIKDTDPLEITAAGGGGSGPTIIGTFTFAGETSHTFNNVFDGTYENIEIVGIGLRFAANTYLRFRVEVGGVVDTGNNYVQSDSFSTGTIPTVDYLILGTPYPGSAITSETYVPSSDKAKFQFRIKCDGVYEDKVPKLFRTTSFGGYVTSDANIQYRTVDLIQGWKPLSNIFPPLTGIQIYTSNFGAVAIEEGTITIYGTKMTP